VGDDRRSLTGEPIAQDQCQTCAQKSERKTADGLVSLKMDGDNSVGKAQQSSCGDGSQQTKPDIAGG